MAGSCCEAPLDTARLEAQQLRVLTQVLLINAATFVMMVVGSWLSASSSLLSGTLDNFGDAVTYALSIAVVGGTASAKGKVALFKGGLITVAAVGVAVQLAYRLLHPAEIVVGTMGVAASLNLAANSACLWLLRRHRHDDVNMSSVWECSRNDVFEGSAVILTTGLVWWLQSGWPDILVAFALLALFTRSALRVLRNAWANLTPAPPSPSP